MKFSATLASLAAVMTIALASSASASTFWAPVGSAVSPSHLGRVAREAAVGLPSFIRGQVVAGEPAQSAGQQNASATGSCKSCDRQSVLPESATMVLLGTVLLGTSFAVRRLGRTHP